MDGGDGGGGAVERQRGVGRSGLAALRGYAVCMPPPGDTRRV